MPALTLGLAIPSALMMVSASLVYPLLGEQGPGTWFEFIVDGRFEHSLLSVVGVSNAWVAVAPVVAAVVAACVLAARATPYTSLVDLRNGVWAVLGWSAVAVVGPSIAGDEATPLDGDPNLIYLVVAGAAASLLTLTLLARRQRRDQPGEPVGPGGESPAAPSAPEPALGSSS